MSPVDPAVILLPITYGIAWAVTITGLTFSLIAAICSVLAVCISWGTHRLFSLRPARAWVGVILWSVPTGMFSMSYRDRYHAAVQLVAAHQPAMSTTEATNAIRVAAQPTIWAVQMILLGIIGGFIWIGTSRARAAAALLLAQGQLPPASRTPGLLRATAA